MNTLLVGPDTDSRRALARALERRQYAVTSVPNTEAATQAVETALVELVVLCTPGGSATSWVEARRNSGADMLIMAVAPRASRQRIHALFAAGVDDCIVTLSDGSHLDVRLNTIEQYHHARPVHRTDSSDVSTATHAQAVVADVSRRALSETDLDVLMAYVAHVVPVLLGVDTCKILEHQPEQHAFTLRAGSGWAREYIGTACIPERYDGMLSQAGYTLASDTPVVVPDPKPTDFTFPPLLADHGMQSGISVAIASSPEPFGVLGAHAHAPQSYSDQAMFSLQAIANVLAGAVEQTRTKRALQVSEANARAILETTVDGIITIDAEGHIESFNKAAEDIFGYDADAVIGKNVRILMPEPYHDEHDNYLQRYHETGEQRIIGIGREVTGKRKDGSTFPMDLAVSEVERHDRITFTGIVRDISERRRLEQEILSISEQERRRIGQDLHDGLGQMLTGTGLLHKNLADQLQREDHPMAEEAAEITDLIRDADQYARDLARGLTPVDLEASGLSEALRRLSDNAQRLFDVHCVFEETGTTLVHNSQAATHLYRITQEAVSNAVRHGKAERIRIILAGGPHQVRLRVHDSGSGFDQERAQNGGMGLRIMKYRARIIGGTFDVSTAVGEGTTVTCTLPRTADAPSSGTSASDSSNGSSSPSAGCPV
ncbi:MAG: PAS domain S-box protein [Longimonas sp.]|uniref:PAS domain S-box protein n=1 Tax=Longimonas sp. TaxID=2039626 RepID=UPI003976179B